MADSSYGEGLGFEVLASSLRADAGDTKTFLEVLANKLGGALPTRTVVERESHLFAREKPVKMISIELGEFRYQIGHARGALSAQRTRVVRGIALKTEALGVDQWLDDLSMALMQLAQQSAQDRASLLRMLM
ncbi:MAG TPA: hypothetical protein VFU32_14325 [Ktedonobacterales bacterium]|nr:hypothetical protein [Ktedonobacterales bacterium]